MASNRSSNEWPSFGKISPFLDLVEAWCHFSGWIKTSGKFPLSKMRRLSQTWKQRRTSERNQHPLKQREPNGNEINNVKDNNDNCNKVRTAYFFTLSVDQITVWVRTWSHLHRVGVIFYLCCSSIWSFWANYPERHQVDPPCMWDESLNKLFSDIFVPTLLTQFL